MVLAAGLAVPCVRLTFDWSGGALSEKIDLTSVGASSGGTLGVVIPSWRRCHEALIFLVVWLRALREEA
jgi:hypothetical protein